MAGNRLPRLHIKRRGWRPESGQSIDYTKFEVRPIPSKKIVELSIEASTTPAGKRSRTFYHHVARPHHPDSLFFRSLPQLLLASSIGGSKAQQPLVFAAM